MPEPSSPTKGDENLLRTKALTEGNVAFVWRDLLCGPHWSKNLPKGQVPRQESMHSAHYPAATPSGHMQVCNRWPCHASLTSKDGSLSSLENYYRQQLLSPWFFLPLSFSVPNLKLLRAEASSSPAWRAVQQAHTLVARGSDPRVDSDQSQHNLWIIKPTNGSGATSLGNGAPRLPR